MRSEIIANFDREKAVKAQMLMASKAKVVKLDTEAIKRVAGADVSFKGNHGFGSVVVLDYKTLKLLSYSLSRVTVKIPYIPTFLAFREVGAIVSALKKLRDKPDVLLVDGHGMLHPRRCGLATHLGIVTGIPTIGVAKKGLIGEVRGEGRVRPVYYKGEVIGFEVYTSKNKKPIYVSVGHMVTLRDALEVVLKTVKPGFRLPEPIRLAHILAKRCKCNEKMGKGL